MGNGNKSYLPGHEPPMIADEMFPFYGNAGVDVGSEPFPDPQEQPQESPSRNLRLKFLLEKLRAQQQGPNEMVDAAKTTTSTMVPGMKRQLGIMEESSRRLGDVRAKMEEGKAQAYKGYRSAVNQMMKSAESDMASLDADVKSQMAKQDELRAEIASFKPDPNKWYKDMNTAQGIFTGLAVIFSGAGQAIAGGRGNPVMDIINKAVDRDVAMQLKEYDSKKDAFRAGQGILQDLYQRKRNLRESVHDAKAMLLDDVKTKIMTLAENTGSQTVSLRAQEAAAMVEQEIQAQKLKALQSQRVTTVTQKVPLPSTTANKKESLVRGGQLMEPLRRHQAIESMLNDVENLESEIEEGWSKFGELTFDRRSEQINAWMKELGKGILRSRGETKFTDADTEGAKKLVKGRSVWSKKEFYESLRLVKKLMGSIYKTQLGTFERYYDYEPIRDKVDAVKRKISGIGDFSKGLKTVKPGATIENVRDLSSARGLLGAR